MTDAIDPDVFADIPPARLAELRDLAQMVDRVMGEIHAQTRSDPGYLEQLLEDPLGVVEETEIGVLLIPGEERDNFAEGLRAWAKEIDDPNQIVSCKSCRTTVAMVCVVVLGLAVFVTLAIAPELLAALAALSWIEITVTVALIGATVGLTAMQVAALICQENGNCL